MLDAILDKLDPILAEMISVALFGWFGSFIRAIFKTRESQENLNRAIASGVDMITDKLVLLMSQNDMRVIPLEKLPQSLVMDVVSYATKSVPDSTKWLKARQETLISKAEGRINMRMLELKQML